MDNPEVKIRRRRFWRRVSKAVGVEFAVFAAMFCAYMAAAAVEVTFGVGAVAASVAATAAGATLGVVVLTCVAAAIVGAGIELYSFFLDDMVPVPTPKFAPAKPTPPLAVGSVVWARVPFEAGVDDEGRASKVRPVFVARISGAGDSKVIVGYPMTSKVEKYLGRSGYRRVTGDWDGPGSVSLMNTNRRVRIPVAEVHRVCNPLVPSPF